MEVDRNDLWLEVHERERLRRDEKEAKEVGSRIEPPSPLLVNLEIGLRRRWRILATPVSMEEDFEKERIDAVEGEKVMSDESEVEKKVAFEKEAS